MHEHDAWLARFDGDDGIDGELTMGAVGDGGGDEGAARMEMRSSRRRRSLATTSRAALGWRRRGGHRLRAPREVARNGGCWTS
jgi:hypothetical protein